MGVTALAATLSLEGGGSIVAVAVAGASPSAIAVPPGKGTVGTSSVGAATRERLSITGVHTLSSRVAGPPASDNSQANALAKPASADNTATG